ncbi:MAG: divergent polysaccharide deacetylase family protein [Candidatus Cloacimonetes bacterium]|nr:divergent polysaccharide deacetylase family protein [Candidatus Cloacimonadota bacterium]MDD4156419.1 divergent polysaccharide deacetylase family protein [Candidatus Cloacimonadota bacterium]
MKTFKLISIIIFTLIIITSCNKKNKQNSNKLQPITEKTTMDKIIIDFSYKLSIQLNTVQKLQKSDGIYYYIPISSSTDIDFADMILQGYIEKSSIDFISEITINKDKFIKKYRDSIHKQDFIIELYDEKISPGIPLNRDNVTGFNKLCIIIDDFGGYDGDLLDKFCQTDQAVTFAIIPQLTHSKTVMHKAVKSGHEVIVHIPMQPENGNIKLTDNTITDKLSNQEIYDQIKSFFTELNYAIGANNHMGSKITQSKPLMQSILKYFVEKDFYFIDSFTIASSIAYTTAQEMGLASARRNLFLDAPENSDEVLSQRIENLKQLKDKQQDVLVITHCFDEDRLIRLNKFIIEARKMGFELVPASKFVVSSPNI